MRRTFLTMVIAAGFAAVAHAHVTVWPRESRAGSSEKYTVRVPTEGKVSTTAVRLEVPAGVTLVAVQAPSGWTHELERDGDRIVAVSWTMEIRPGEFAEFSFLARNPREADQIAWKVEQRYADRTSSHWAGPAGDRQPAPVTTLLPAPPR